MTLVRYCNGNRTPLAGLQNRMSDLFNTFFSDFSPVTHSETAWYPAIDLAEQDDKYLVTAELPGVSNDDVDITVHDHVLSITGKKESTKEHKDEHYHHIERHFGSFHREIRLPSAVDKDKVRASYRNGVLTVTLPKSEKALPKRIPIKS